MSEQSSQEPTMEEILASIRRIISEDDAPGEEGGPTAESLAEAARGPMPDLPPEPEPDYGTVDAGLGGAGAAALAPEPEPFAPVADDSDDDDLELTQKVETHGDLDVLAPTEPEPEPAPAPAAPAATLVSDHVAAAAAATFGQLSSSLLMPAEGRTLEDVVRELLRPLLQHWLDANLPGIVESAVQAEVERIARGRVR
jgi:cell pole-organizing protein PopZ